MNRALALAAAPLFALLAVAPATAATAPLPTSTTLKDQQADVSRTTTFADGMQFSMNPVSDDMDIFQVQARSTTSKTVVLKMTIDDLTDEMATGTHAEPDGTVVPNGYFSFPLTLNDNKKASLAVGRKIDGTPAVFTYDGSRSGAAVTCGEVKVAFDTTKDTIIYTVPVDCIGSKRRVKKIRASSILNSNVLDSNGTRERTTDHGKNTKPFRLQ